MTVRAIERVERLLRDWPSNESIVLMASDVRGLLALAKQRDELLAALEMSTEFHDQGHSPCACVEARAAIAAARGG